MASGVSESLSNIAKSLCKPRLNKDSLIKLLRQAEDNLSKLRQSETYWPQVEPLRSALVKRNLLYHEDNEVKLLMAVCFCEIIRIMAPDPGYSDEILKDIFRLIISMFAKLSDMSSPYFTRRVKILETFAALKCCLLMLDICEDLVLEMFNIFFSIARVVHEKSLYKHMLSIMTCSLDANLSQPLLDVILRNLLQKEKHVPSASPRLAASVILNCSERLGPHIQRFLMCSILDKEGEGSKLKEFYHEIIYEIVQLAPQMLISVIPNLTHELLTDQVDVRIKAVDFVRRLFTLSGHHIAVEYRLLFVQFLNRFSDKSSEVRLCAVKCAKSCYTANPSGLEAIEILSALEGRLLDFDDKVRLCTVNVVCDLVKSYLKCIPSDLILKTMERLRDKKVSVRKCVMDKLVDLYQHYCIKCSEGFIEHTEHFEQIPCRVLALCFDKDCKEFRPQSMELVFGEKLFPNTLSVEERVRHWVSFTSFFTPAHMKALNSILFQKRRVQQEMEVYLKGKEKNYGSEDEKKGIFSSFKKMASSFANPLKAEESFQELHKMKDSAIFKALLQLLDDGITTISAESIRNSLLKKLGEKHALHDFLGLLSSKCLYTIFNAEHV